MGERNGPGLFLVVFGLATLFLAYTTVDTLFGVTRVRVEPGVLRVRHGPFGVGPTRALHLHEIESIRAVPEVQYGARVYSKIRIQRGGGGERSPAASGPSKPVPPEQPILPESRPPIEAHPTPWGAPAQSAP